MGDSSGTIYVPTNQSINIYTASPLSASLYLSQGSEATIPSNITLSPFTTLTINGTLQGVRDIFVNENSTLVLGSFGNTAPSKSVGNFVFRSITIFADGEVRGSETTKTTIIGNVCVHPRGRISNVSYNGTFPDAFSPIPSHIF